MKKLFTSIKKVSHFSSKRKNNKWRKVKKSERAVESEIEKGWKKRGLEWSFVPHGRYKVHTSHSALTTICCWVQTSWPKSNNWPAVPRGPVTNSQAAVSSHVWQELKWMLIWDWVSSYTGNNRGWKFRKGKLVLESTLKDCNEPTNAQTYLALTVSHKDPRIPQPLTFSLGPSE